MGAARKAADAATTAAEMPPGDEAIARYQAALIEGKTEDEAKAIGWPDSLPPEVGEALPEGQCDDTQPHERHDILWGEYGSTDYRCCEGVPERKTHCPTPAECFPYGMGTGYHGCVHGETLA